MKDRPPFTREDVEVVEKTTPYQGYFRIDRYRLRHRLHEGGWSDVVTREVFERGHATAVLLYDPGRDVLVMIEQFRPGALAAGDLPWLKEEQSPWLMECVAGIIDAGESPEDVARREAVEEANCEILELMPICHYLASPGATSETLFVFLGRVDAAGAGGIHGLDHEHEDIRVHVVPTAEAFAWLDQDKVANVVTLAALQWLRIHHDRVRAAWT